MSHIPLFIHQYLYEKKIYFTAILLDPNATLSDHLLHAVLNLLHREIADHGRHLPHYFLFFHTYANLGQAEKAQLLKVSSFDFTIILQFVYFLDKQSNLFDIIIDFSISS